MQVRNAFSNLSPTSKTCQRGNVDSDDKYAADCREDQFYDRGAKPPRYAVSWGPLKHWFNHRFPPLTRGIRHLRRHGRSSFSLSMALANRPVHFVPILGMHRSGTSCITRVLGLSGLHLGDDLIEANQHNPEGFWESREAIAINEEMLKRHGAGYLNPPAYCSTFPGELYHRAARYLVKLAQQPVVGWKDPRTTLTWPAWAELLSLSDHTLVACFRHPREVVGSLRTIYRDMTEAEALRAWSNYNQRLLGYVGKVVWVNFNAPLAPQIARICGRVGLKYDPAALASYNSALVHHASCEADDGGDEADYLYRCILGLWRLQLESQVQPSGAVDPSQSR